MNLLKNTVNRAKKVSRIKKIGVVIVIIILIVLVVIFRPKKPTPTYTTSEVSKGSIISTISESGNVSSISQVDISSPTDGVIEDVYVKNGDTVNAGQNLFKVKSTATPAQQEQAYASLISAQNGVNSTMQSKQAMQASLEQSRKAVLDAQDAVDQMNNNINSGAGNPSTKKSYTQNEIDSINSSLTSARESFTASETKYNESDSSITAAQASLDAATSSYNETKDSIVTSPIAGTVANFSLAVGSSVSGGQTSTTNTANSNSNNSSSSSTGSTVLVVGDFSKLGITVQVNEIDIPTIHAGQQATVTLSAFPDKTFVARIASVDTIGTENSGVVTYNAYLDLIAPPADIRPGMSATAIIQTARHDNVLKVPSMAVQTTNGQSYIRVMKNGKITQTPVTTGISSDSETEIDSGLSVGQTVVTNVVIPTTITGGSNGASPFGGGGFGGGGRAGFGGGAVRAVSGTRAGGSGGTFFIQK
jgi:multidrug efflux pump subunit AcrA (membrane-fusion protein)